MDEKVRLGAFVLGEAIGHGAMGEVWRARHVEQHVPAAVKVIQRASAREERMVEAFRREVHAVARLLHPNIVLVLDHGLVDGAAEAASGGRLVAGSPYLAMELAGMGSLRQVPGPHPWLRVRAVLLALLDGLAHAHARGVVHRDIKPENILFGAPGDVRPGLKLSDFGIAHAWLEAGDGRRARAGTPAYMAPEQCEGRLRDIGPWSDLYAVGCVGWELVCGRVAFDRAGSAETMRAHVEEPPPLLDPGVVVPRGFAAWVEWMLATEIGARCGRAADAAWALRELGAAPVTRIRAAVQVPVSLPTTVNTTLGVQTVDDWVEQPPTRRSRPSVASTGRSSVASTSGEVPIEPPAPAVPRAARDLPPMPRAWRAPDAVMPQRLVGVGLGLWGIRSVPMAGRDEERERLWGALSEVRLAGGPRVLLLRGAAGVGKSRLAAWLCERSHELGAASFMHATFAVGGADPLAGMLAGHLGCAGLDDIGALARVTGVLRAAGLDDAWEARALTEAMRGALVGESAPLVRFDSPDARLAAIAREVDRAASERPLVVWLDDVQWGADGLQLAQQLMRRASGAPVLVVLTARDDALADRPGEAQLVADVVSRPETSVIPLRPLDEVATVELVEGLLGLESGLAHTVVERVGGNPLFAVQIVGDWVRRGALEAAPTGFGLRPGELAALPDDVHALWAARVAALVTDLPAGGTALEVAALLGQAVSVREWGAACRLAGVDLDAALVEELELRGLGARDGDRFALAHGMLRESLERGAREEGRAPGLADACARAVDGDVERAGRLLRLAGRHEEAASALLRAARRADHRGEYRRAFALLDERERALEAVGLAPEDARWGDGWGLRATVAINLGELATAEAEAERVLARCPALGWASAEQKALFARASLVHMRGGLTDAIALYESATELAAMLGDESASLRCLYRLGWAELQRGDVEQAQATYESALRLATERGDAVDQGNAHNGLSSVLRRAGDLDAALLHRERAAALFEQVGAPNGLAVALNGLGEIARERGDLAAAEQAYRRASTAYEAAGSNDRVIPRLNLGLLLVERGRSRELPALLLPEIAELERRGRRDLLTSAHSLLTVAAAAGRAWRRLGRHLDASEQLLDAGVQSHPDDARLLGRAAELAMGGGRSADGRRAHALAARHWRAVGRPVEAAAAERSASVGGPLTDTIPEL